MEAIFVYVSKRNQYPKDKDAKYNMQNYIGFIPSNEVENTVEQLEDRFKVMNIPCEICISETLVSFYIKDRKIINQIFGKETTDEEYERLKNVIFGFFIKPITYVDKEARENRKDMDRCEITVFYTIKGNRAKRLKDYLLLNIFTPIKYTLDA